MVYVKIPASCANMGPGFDSIGMALQLYNEIWVQESAGLDIESLDDTRVPLDETNLVYHSILRFYNELGIKKNFSGLKIRQKNNIPISKGFGSSAACIVGGVLAANELSGAKLDRYDLLPIASKIEGHSDNVSPALFGGVFVGVHDFSLSTGIKLDVQPLIDKGLMFGAIVPDFSLSTEKARSVLPSKYAPEALSFNLMRYGLLVASIATADIAKIGLAMEDKAHEPYRSKIIEGYDDAMALLKRHNPVGTFLSGSGPAIFVLYDSADYPTRIEKELNGLKGGWRFVKFMPDANGAEVDTRAAIDDYSNST